MLRQNPATGKTPIPLLLLATLLLTAAAVAGGEGEGEQGDGEKKVRVHKVVVKCDDEAGDCAAGKRVIRKRIVRGEGGEHVWVEHGELGPSDHPVFHARAHRSFLGVMLEEAEEGDDTPAIGARIARVVEGSPAAAAGLTAGDLVTAVDGETVASARQLVRAIGTREAGATITLELLRDGRVETVTATLSEPRDHGLEMREVKKVVRCFEGEDCARPEDFDLELDFDCDAERCELEMECAGGECTCTVNGAAVDCAELTGEAE